MSATKPAVDYTNKDYESLRAAMLDLARLRLPEWTDRSPADLGMLLIDLFAYMGDILLYYQDRIASESFLATATERRSVLHLLRLIDYQLKPPSPAAADLTLTFNQPGQGETTVVNIPQGAQFESEIEGEDAQTFEYIGQAFSIDLTSDQVRATTAGKLVYAGLPVRHSTTVDFETIGSSTGEPNQRFALSTSPLIPETLEVEVDEGAGFVRWNRRENLLYFAEADGSVTVADSDSTDYYFEFDESDSASVVFGDGTYGKIPAPRANGIRARYQVGGGTEGNVPAQSITKAVTSITHLDTVTNPNAAAGGSERETVEHAVRFGPLAYRSGKRAVTLNDFVSLAHDAGGVAKAHAFSKGWNQVDLYVAPEGDACAPAPEELKNRLRVFFEDKRMVGTFVRVRDAVCVPLEVEVLILVEHNYRPEDVRLKVENAVKDVFAYSKVNFGQTLYLSKVFEAAESVAGVKAAEVPVFRRSDEKRVTLSGGRRTSGAASGRILTEQTEIPHLEQLTVRVEDYLK